MIEELCDACVQCSSLKLLPKTIIHDTNSAPQGFGTNFSVDVLERNSQKVLVVRENLSQFIQAAIIPDQTANTLREEMFRMILPFSAGSGAKVRTDGHKSFESIRNETVDKESLWFQHGIVIELGRSTNVNKNPTGENAIKLL